jgi:hypothetical protein
MAAEPSKAIRKWSRIRPEGLSWARSSMVKLEEKD